MAGKGDKPRPVDKDGWETSKLWDNLKKEKERKERAGETKGNK